jgi:hypothetical protein
VASYRGIACCNCKEMSALTGDRSVGNFKEFAVLFLPLVWRTHSLSIQPSRLQFVPCVCFHEIAHCTFVFPKGMLAHGGAFWELSKAAFSFFCKQIQSNGCFPMREDGGSCRLFLAQIRQPRNVGGSLIQATGVGIRLTVPQNKHRISELNLGGCQQQQQHPWQARSKPHGLSSTSTSHSCLVD